LANDREKISSTFKGDKMLQIYTWATQNMSADQELKFPALPIFGRAVGM